MNLHPQDSVPIPREHQEIQNCLPGGPARKYIGAQLISFRDMTIKLWASYWYLKSKLKSSVPNATNANIGVCCKSNRQGTKQFSKNVIPYPWSEMEWYRVLWHLVPDYSNYSIRQQWPRSQADGVLWLMDKYILSSLFHQEEEYIEHTSSPKSALGLNEMPHSDNTSAGTQNLI